MFDPLAFRSLSTKVDRLLCPDLSFYPGVSEWTTTDSSSPATSRSTPAIPLLFPSFMRNHVDCLQDVFAHDSDGPTAPSASLRKNSVQQDIPPVLPDHDKLLLVVPTGKPLDRQVHLSTPPTDACLDKLRGVKEFAEIRARPTERTSSAQTTPPSALHAIPELSPDEYSGPLVDKTMREIEKPHKLAMVLTDRDVPCLDTGRTGQAPLSNGECVRRALPVNLLPRVLMKAIPAERPNQASTTKNSSLPTTNSSLTQSDLRPPVPAVKAKSVAPVRKLSPSLIRITRQTAYDLDFERAGSGEYLVLRVQAVESVMPVLYAWVSLQPMNTIPPEVIQMEEDVARFAMTSSLQTFSIPRFGQAVAVRLGERGCERTWTRGEVVQLTPNSVTVRLVDRGGFTSIALPSHDLRALNAGLAARPVLSWRARIVGFPPSRYQASTAAALAKLLVGHSVAASLVLWHPEPLVRLFLYSSPVEDQRPLELPLVLLRRQLEADGLLPRYGIVLYVSKDPATRHFLLVDLRDVYRFEAIQAAVFDDTRSRLPVAAEDILAAVDMDGMFCRVLLLSQPLSDNTIHVELADYGGRMLVPTECLHGLSRPATRLQTPSVLCTLPEVSPSGHLDDWPVTACRLSQTQGNVMVYTVTSLLEKGGQAVRIWDEKGEEISRYSGSCDRVREFVRARDVPYFSPLLPGDVIDVTVTGFDWGHRTLTVAVELDVFLENAYMEGLMDSLQIDGQVMSCRLTEMPEEGVVVASLSDGFWCRAIVAERERDLPGRKVLVFLMDFGTFESVPLTNLAEINTLLAVLPRHGRPLILKGVDTLTGVCDPDVIGRNHIRARVLNRKCQLEITKVDDWFYEVVLCSNKL